MRRVLFFTALILAYPLFAAAQDGHYWDNQYGTKGELLGGVVVGSPSDLSATFYNPGWISLHGDASVLLTTKAAEVYSINVQKGAGQDIQPQSTTVTASPGYLAGRFSSSTDDGWQWAYSYLQKVKFEFDASGIRVDGIEPVPTLNNSWFSGEAFRKARTNEYWYGITMSRRLGENIGLGFSPYVVQRSMKSRFQLAAQGLWGSDEFAQSFLVNEFDFWHVRLLGKIGLAVQGENFSYGVTLTTPGLGIMGTGSVYSTANQSGLDLDGDGQVDPPYLSSNNQVDLSASWQSPVSVAVGASWKPSDTALHVTAEWFDSVSTRRVMDPADFRSQSDPAEVNSYRLEYGAKSLINFGVAVDHSFSRKFALYGAFRSDFSSIPETREGQLQITTWDLWHFTVGASFTFLDIEFTSGLQFSTGSDNTDRFINFDPEENEGVIGFYGENEIRYRRLKALIGFNLPFGTAPE